jgi:hypothetical protein
MSFISRFHKPIGIGLQHHHHHQPINVPLLSHYYCWGIKKSLRLHIKRTGHNPPREPRADWSVQTTANIAGTKASCLSKHEATRDNKFLVTHPMTLLNYCDRTPERTDCRAIELLTYLIHLSDSFSAKSMLEIVCDQMTMSLICGYFWVASMIKHE